ncbi:MAG: DNA topology modulation protein [Clostridia bacterium]|nr:DNA topology modulation protein [Clostridia bacterium]
MKIAIIGYSGSGKSTLAGILAEKYNTPILHFDRVQFLPNWVIREQDEKIRMTKEFLDSNNSWVIDGNYSKLFFDRRMEEADEIIMMKFNRISSLFRAYNRYIKYKNKTRPDMAEGCNEKFDFEFASWILWKGRTKAIRQHYRNVIKTYGDKVTVIKNQRQLSRYIENI